MYSICTIGKQALYMTIDLFSNLDSNVDSQGVNPSPSHKQTLLLVDGSSYLYRAFYALPNLRNQAGEPTGAVYGIVNMMRRLVADFPTSTHRVCVFDAKGKTFRDDLYPEYKATRSPMPDDLRTQIEWVHTIVAALGWHVLTVPGVEADDVMGTLAVQAAATGCHTVISTGDKDMAQLVNPSVLLVDTMKQERMGVMGVEDNFGVPPERIVDYLSLIGDTSDNVPGVYKCGPKTAVKWLQTYGSLEHLINKADEIKGVVGDNLRQAIANNQFTLTRQLLTIKCDVDLSNYVNSFDALKTPLPNLTVQKTLFDQLGFRTWLRELTGDPTTVPVGDARVLANKAAPPSPIPTVQYETIFTVPDLQRWLNKIQTAPLVAVDTETTGLNVWQARLVGISLCCEAGIAAYIPVGHTYNDAPEQLPLSQVLALLKPWLESDAQQKVLQHAKFDMHIFANHGITLRGVAHDTLLAAYVLEAHRRNNLSALAERYLGRSGISYETLCGKGAKAITIDQVSIEQVAVYAAEDADFTWQLHHLMYPLIQADAGLSAVYALEIASQPVLFEIERTGVNIDTQLLHTQSHELGVELHSLEAQAHTIANQVFNLNSPKQLAEVMYTHLGYPIQSKTATGAPSTDEDTLQALAQAVDSKGQPCLLPAVILQHRSLAKLKNTYTDPLPTLIEQTTGRVHTHYSQAAVITGRLSSSEPNLQNIPIKTTQGRRIRQAFVAAEGCQLLSADYSQIELRIMAHLSQDAALIQAFKEGVDVHRATAAEIFGISMDKIEQVTSEQRRYAKTINFGLIYGMSAFGLANALGISNTEAKHYIERYFARYPGVKAYMTAIKSAAKEQGYVSTVLGRRIYLPEINANGPRRSGAERAAINAPMQGTAADLIKQAMVNIATWLKLNQLNTKIIMQVHDELILEVPEYELQYVQSHIAGLMTQALDLSVPLVVETGVGKHWDAAH
jgi:DNA polymerase I